ncbi:YhgE/Pip domain-containing protein [Actinomadura sp. NPDC047616]|uniref:YhgE/Pip domain-containing protein n=1 Tax=Actinomadura sp. NPDC047616 TaxID=3155914 RepID=UPI0034054762
MRLPAVSTAGLELRRFQRNRLTRIALAALVLLPLLYAGLYLWSFWDPYARLSHVPVALVDEDRPAKAGDRTVHAGADLAAELKRRQVFDWRTVDAREAREGVRSGRYYMALTIPSDFSARIAAPSGDGTPAAAALRLQLNDANNYVIGTLAESAFKEISAAAGEDATRGYLDQIFVSFGKLHGELGRAADGAGRLADGAGQAEQGADRLAKGAQEAEQGAGKLKNGIGEARSGSRRLTSGLDTLHDGTQRLAEGNRQLNAGVQQLVARVDQAADVAVPLLRENAPEIRRGALAVADAADALADAADTLPAQTGQAVRRAERAQADLERTLREHPEIPADTRQELRQAAGEVVAVARQVDSYVREHTGDLRKVATQARAVERSARKIAADAPALADRIDRARRDVDRLGKGAAQAAAGAAQVNDGTGRLLSGASQLTGGLGTLSGGAGELQSGLGRLSGGAVDLGTALAQISDGNRELADGLHEGAGRVPAYGKDERQARADMMSSPVRLASTNDNKVANYGTGFAPFFVPLALWVGGMVVYMLLRPLNPRALAGTAPGWRVALAGWLPAVTIGIGQVGVVLAVLHFGLGLHARHWVGLVAFLSLASAAFLAVIQWVNARFGPAGRIVALALLMLQLTSAAGTYPIETSPGFFQAIQPYLPMPWAVRAVRHLIAGGDPAAVWQGGAVLAAFLAGGLALTALAARHNRVWTVKRLHPALKL